MTPERELRELIAKWRSEESIHTRDRHADELEKLLAAAPVLTGAPDCCLACGGTGKAAPAPTPAPPTKGEINMRCCNHPECENPWPCQAHKEWNDGPPAEPVVPEREPQVDLENYNVIGCGGGEHCVCQDGYGHKKYAQTPIPVPLADKSKEELVRIVEMMQEDLQWYVAERNRLLAAAPRAAGGHREPSLTEKQILAVLYHGRTMVNFNHVPEVTRAIDWLSQDFRSALAAPPPASLRAEGK